MATKNPSNRIILKESATLDLMALKKMVKEYIDIYYGEKFKVSKHVYNGSFWSFQDVPAKTTLTTVFNLFKMRFKDDNTHLRKLFRYLDKNYSSAHKLRDLTIFKLKIDGYSFKQIADITGLSIVRVKQVYYIVKKLVEIKNDSRKLLS